MEGLAGDAALREIQVCTQDRGKGFRYSKVMAVPRPPRIPFRCPVEFTHEEGVTGLGTLFSLSLGGCAVQSDTPVSDTMLVTFRLALSDGSAPIIIEMGRVRWATTQEFGVESLIVLQKERKKLDWFLRTAVSKPASTDTMPSQAA